MANKTVFTNEITDYIIENVHAAEYVWNHASPLYKLKSMKCDFWIKLTAEINTKFQPAVRLTQGDVSRKWNNLKSYYTFERQKFMKAKQCEYVPDMVEVDWKNKSKMDFLSKLIVPNFKRHKNDKNTKLNRTHDGFFNNSNFESQDESWTGDSGTQTSFQVPELATDVEEEKFSDVLKEREIYNQTDDQQTTSLTDVHSSTQLPISTSDDDDDQTSINKSYKRPRETADRLTSVVADLIEQQNSMLSRTASTLEHPEMYAFWDSIIKELPGEALPEIKLEVTAVLHTIYKKYKK